MMNVPEPFVPDPSLAEEWDNPEMTAFKWQEAEERVAFGGSHEAGDWLEAFRTSMPSDVVIRRVAPLKKFPYRIIKLPW